METLNYLIGCAVVAQVWIGLGLILAALVFELARWLLGCYDCDFDSAVCPDAGGKADKDGLPRDRD